MGQPDTFGTPRGAVSIDHTILCKSTISRSREFWLRHRPRGHATTAIGRTAYLIIIQVAKPSQVQDVDFERFVVWSVLLRLCSPCYCECFEYHDGTRHACNFCVRACFCFARLQVTLHAYRPAAWLGGSWGRRVTLSMLSLSTRCMGMICSEDHPHCVFEV